MASLPNWIECKKITSKNNAVYMELSLKYVPLRFLVDVVIKAGGWKIWQYPKIIKTCLDRVSIIFQANDISNQPPNPTPCKNPDILKPMR